MATDRMGDYGQNDKPYECDGCGATTLCTPSELTNTYGWKRHAGGGTNTSGALSAKGKAKPRWTLLLCDDCEAKGKQS